MEQKQLKLMIESKIQVIREKIQILKYNQQCAKKLDFNIESIIKSSEIVIYSDFADWLQQDLIKEIT